MSAHRPPRSSLHQAGWLLLSVFFALSIACLHAAEPALRASDWKAIKQVIAAQRAALVAGDGEKAFGYATPSLRTQFGDAETFMAMVQLGYAALLSARRTEFLEGAVIEGLVIQPLRLIDRDDSVRVALYTMEKQPNGAWRISGCRIAPSTVQTARREPVRSATAPANHENRYLR